MRVPSLRPTPEGAAALTLSGFFFLLATNLMAGWLFFLTAFLVAVVVVGAATALVGTRAIRVEEAVASPAVEEGTVTLLLRVRADRSVRFLRLAAAAGGRRGEVFFPVMRTGTGEHSSIRLPAPTRGVYPLKLRVISLGLLGMFRAERELPGRAEVVVRPRYQGLSHLPVGLCADGGPQDPQRRRGEELFGIREYQSGDPARHIHWRSSARHRRLLVKEFAAPQAPEVAIVVDTDRRQAEADLDAAARAAASIAWTALRRDWRVTLLWCGQDGPAAICGPWEQIWDALARLRADGPTLAQALARISPRLCGSAPVAVTSLPTATSTLPAGINTPSPAGSARLIAASGPSGPSQLPAPPIAPVVLVAPAGSAAGWEFDRDGGVRCAR
ncbi:MAG: DUF58 domain-containing protein [Armatimonadota bacterium]|nr:DUF58 domain-containing protein [Armatimonadota bacterium]MDR7463717.1 DUF58 domain-containing protein [Armatimonadota bacterium]MDR7470190.1 DUF58 domain-containing protein [Armatimonadota bacterium]MDR7473618.1 DUF58 domain-containing protein [Armatimonadota bacterium]MDR7538861.1 DUF58 domain-containing protein [Armatimonadota bacterium]